VRLRRSGSADRPGGTAGSALAPTCAACPARWHAEHTQRWFPAEDGPRRRRPRNPAVLAGRTHPAAAFRRVTGNSPRSRRPSRAGAPARQCAVRAPPARTTVPPLR